MIITHHGIEAFKVQFGDTVLAFNPVSKDSSYKKATRFGADVALISTNHPDMNGADSVVFGEKIPVVVTGPGEYEVQGIVIKGFQTKSNYDKMERINTVYLVTLEGMNLLFLGALDQKELASSILEEIDTVDIVFVPVGGEGVLDPNTAQKLAISLEPKIIIPMHFEGVGQKDALKTFLKEGGHSGAESVDKLTIKQKDLIGKEGEAVVIKPQ
jgi:L-ascorbate metabolism protein UlaG (beta-lactamase superfamily)